MKPMQWAEKVGWLILGTTLALCVFPTIWNVDIFWHMAAGNWMLREHALPDTDVFSAVEPDRLWIPFQWLYEVLATKVHEATGLLGLRVMTGGVLLGSALLLRRQLMKVGIQQFTLMALVGILFVLFGDRIRVRPHVFNLLFTLLLLPLLLGQWKEESLGRSLPWLLSIVGLWANLHAGGVLIFLTLLFTLPAGTTLERLLTNSTPEHRQCNRKAWILWVSALLVACSMPNFFRGAIHSLTMLGASESLIEEWKPAWSWMTLAISFWSREGRIIPTMTILALAPWLLLGASLALPAWDEELREKKTPYWGMWLLSIGTCLIAIRYGRFAWLCIIPLAFFFSHTRLRHFEARHPRSALTLALMIVGLVFHYQVSVQRGGLMTTVDQLTEDLDERRFPVDGAHFLSTANIEGKAWVLPNWGGYLLWTSQSKILVLSDGRGNYSQEVANDLNHIYKNRWKPAHAAKTLEAYNRYPEINLIVMQAPILPNGIEHPGWTRIFPPNREWIETLQLPQAMDSPQKEVILVRDEHKDALNKAHETWKEVAARMPAPKPSQP